ncbi:MAG: carboxypeptidase regulatory-like domain-containing protein [Thaumarchaeota archaeon]|nr:carboxypeptidase regulatory-like domain-containing protein [Nitrososphaerota archaeon]
MRPALALFGIVLLILGGMVAVVTASTGSSLVGSSSTTSASTTSNGGPVTVSIPSNFQGYAGQPLTFSVAGSGGSPPYVYTYSFGDGVVQSGGSVMTHTYQSAGSFTLQVTATDSANSVGNGFATVNIAQAPNVGSGQAFVIFYVDQQGPYTNPNNYPIPGASIVVKNVATGATQTATTNTNGAAAFTVKAASYSVSISATGYATFTQIYTIVSSSNPQTFTVVLTPRHAVSQRAGSAPDLTWGSGTSTLSWSPPSWQLVLS